MNSKILIAIPVYNGQLGILKTVESCLLQTDPCKIIIVDNCSTDLTEKIIKDHYHKNQYVDYYRNENNLGRTGNWNRVLDIFEGYPHEYIKFLFCGDELKPSCIEEVNNVIKMYPKIGAIVFDYEFNNYEKISISKNNLDGYLSVEKVAKLNMIDGGFLGSIVSNVYGKIAIGTNRFSSLFIGKNDFDFSVLYNKDAYYIPKVLSRTNIDHRKTFKLSIDYWIQCEYIFNRSFWLEKYKNQFSESDYSLAKKRIFLDFIKANHEYFSFKVYFEVIIISSRIAFINLIKLSYKTFLNLFARKQ